MASKQIVIAAYWDHAKQNGRRCATSEKHVFKKGDVRFVIGTGRDVQKYCRDCAKKILQKGQERLGELLTQEPPAEAP